MKASHKGQRGIKGMLLAHGEKAVVGVVAVCAALFVWKSLGQESLPADKQHGPLAQLVSQSQQKITNYRWEDAPPEEIRQFDGPLGGVEAAVVPDAYQRSDSWLNPPVVPPSAMRTDPVLLAAQDLEGHGGSGLIALVDESIQAQRVLEEAKRKQQEQLDEEQERQRREREPDNDRGERGEREGGRGSDDDPNLRRVASKVTPAGVSLKGDERVIIAYWATIVAKVPVGEQWKRYRDVLENSRSFNASNDFPAYRGFVVQRAEAGSPGQELKWETAGVYTPDKRNIGSAYQDTIVDRLTADWFDPPDEIIADVFNNPELVFPLAPLVGRNWGSEVNHSDLPLEWEMENEEVAPEKAPEEKVETDQMMFGTADRGPSRDRGPGSPRAPRTSVGSDPHRGEERSRGPVGGGRRQSNVAEAPYYLLRFFDFNVQPGKRYVYRVRIALTDVNDPSLVNRNSLDQSVWDRLDELKKAGGRRPVPDFRLTDWSDPSPAVTIPQAGNVRVAGARAVIPDRHNDEPRLQVLVESFGLNKEDNKAIQAAKEADAYRGQVLNMQAEAEVLTDENQNIRKISSFDYRTDVMVVDIDGGERLNRDLTVPARALLMDSAGRLYIRRELNDLDDVQYHRDLFAPSERRRGEDSAPADVR